MHVHVFMLMVLIIRGTHASCATHTCEVARSRTGLPGAPGAPARATAHVGLVSIGALDLQFVHAGVIKFLALPADASNNKRSRYTPSDNICLHTIERTNDRASNHALDLEHMHGESATLH